MRRGTQVDKKKKKNPDHRPLKMFSIMNRFLKNVKKSKKLTFLTFEFLITNVLIVYVANSTSCISFTCIIPKTSVPSLGQYMSHFL